MGGSAGLSGNTQLGSKEESFLCELVSLLELRDEPGVWGDC